MKFRLTILFIAFSLTSFSQNLFPGDDISILSGNELKVKPISEMLQRYGYDGFYKDEKLKKKYQCCDGSNSKYKSLVDKTFKVLSIEPYTDIIDNKKYKVKLFNSETGDIYFDYDPRYEHKWVFEFAGDFRIPDGFFCKKIEMIADKFTGDTTYISPAASGFRFIKKKSRNSSIIYLAKNQPGATLNVSVKGLTILLENGKRIDKPNAKLDVKPSPSKYSSGYVYSVFEELNESDIELLLNNPITDSRLYIYDGTTSKDDAKTLIEYLKCIVNK